MELLRSSCARKILLEADAHFDPVSSPRFLKSKFAEGHWQWRFFMFCLQELHCGTIVVSLSGLWYRCQVQRNLHMMLSDSVIPVYYQEKVQQKQSSKVLKEEVD